MDILKMNWLAIGFLFLGVFLTVARPQNTPYICDGKDDRVCDQYRCICRRKPSTVAYYTPDPQYEF
ncbi:uncharacterized protein LOC108092349 [Drosophila ficusphila]|uniref:uncharacterized protein LOC108092349 n=1 Tax=Drosophila ficusphila TaxID=30025 RepID=UPI0007E6D791|nr:uncharacterized protein LOC108092349 [Drosophila ficusphila]